MSTHREIAGYWFVRALDTEKPIAALARSGKIVLAYTDDQQLLLLLMKLVRRGDEYHSGEKGRSNCAALRCTARRRDAEASWRAGRGMAKWKQRNTLLAASCRFGAPRAVYAGAPLGSWPS